MLRNIVIGATEIGRLMPQWRRPMRKWAISAIVQEASKEGIIMKRALVLFIGVAGFLASGQSVWAQDSNLGGAHCALGEERVVDHTEQSGFSYFLSLGSDGYDLVQYLQNAEVLDVFNISGNVERMAGQNVVKANLVTFSAGGTLTFLDVAAPVWAIVAEELRLFGSDNSTTGIFRDPDYALETSSSGTNGGDGVSLPRHNSDHGAHGAPGGNGGPGERGASQDLPCLIIIVRNVVFADSSSPQEFTLNLEGIRGGNGGNGGVGANGQAGNHASWRWLSCKNEPGDGGNGGQGGRGGDGGPGGRGGDGGSIIFIGHEQHGKEFLSSQIRQEPGQPGEPGRGGPGGTGGIGGDDGSRAGVCWRNASVGQSGIQGQDGNLGSLSTPGKRGRSQIVSVGERQINEIMALMFPSH